MSPKQDATATVKLDLHCHHINGRGHRCRMLIDTDHHTPNGEKSPAFCPYHLNQRKAKAPDPEAVAADLLARAGEGFGTPDAINNFLGNLLRQLALGRVQRRDAITMAYISQLLLNTVLDQPMDAEQDAAGNSLLLRALASAREKDRAKPRANEPAPSNSVPGVRSSK